MASNNAPSPRILLFVIFLVVTPPPSHSFSFVQWRIGLSLAHSVMTRVATLRASRGDSAGAERAKLIAEKLERGLDLGSPLRFRKAMWPVGWDYVQKYPWRDIASADLFGAVKDMNELLRSLTELTAMDSDNADRTAWVMRNYETVLRLSNSLLRKLLDGFRQSELLKEVAEMAEKELVQGDLLRDCLELGSSDLKDLIQAFKDLALQFSSPSAGGREL